MGLDRSTQCECKTETRGIRDGVAGNQIDQRFLQDPWAASLFTIKYSNKDMAEKGRHRVPQRCSTAGALWLLGYNIATSGGLALVRNANFAPQHSLESSSRSSNNTSPGSLSLPGVGFYLLQGLKNSPLLRLLWHGLPGMIFASTAATAHCSCVQLLVQQ